MGVDRLVMIMAGKDAIRDVIAFPKSQSGGDPLTGAPAPVGRGPTARPRHPSRAPAEGRRTRHDQGGCRWLSSRPSNSRSSVRPTWPTSPRSTRTVRPHLSPLWADTRDGMIVLNTADGRVKVENVRRDPRVSVAIHDKERPASTDRRRRHRRRHHHRGRRRAHAGTRPRLRRRGLDPGRGSGAPPAGDPARPRPRLDVGSALGMPNAVSDQPLAARMRPRTFEEYEGQAHLVGEGTALVAIARRRQPPVDHPVGAGGHRQDHARASARQRRWAPI